MKGTALAPQGDFSGKTRDLRAEQCQLVTRFFSQIINRQIEAGFGNVGSYGLAQRAVTYATDFRGGNPVRCRESYIMKRYLSQFIPVLSGSRERVISQVLR
jgi:hypothetical protein